MSVSPAATILDITESVQSESVEHVRSEGTRQGRKSGAAEAGSLVHSNRINALRRTPHNARRPLQLIIHRPICLSLCPPAFVIGRDNDRPQKQPSRMASSQEASKSQSRRGGGPPPNAPRWPAAMAPGVPRGTYKPRGGPQRTLTAPLPRSQLPASSPAPPTTTTPEPVETGYDVMARREQVCEDELCDIYQKQSGMAEFLARERANAEVGDQYRRIVRRRDTGNSNSPSPKRENLPPILEETSTSANEEDWTEISAEIKRVGETLSVIQPLNPANTAQQEAVQDMANVSLPSGRYPGGRYIALTHPNNVGSQTQPRQTSQITKKEKEHIDTKRGLCSHIAKEANC